MAAPFIHRITKALGWHSAAPTNVTREEKRRGDRNQRDMTSHVSKFRDATGLTSDPVARDAQLIDMMGSDTIEPIIELYTEEATQPDVKTKKCLWYKCSDKEIEDELNKMLERIGNEDHLSAIVANVAGRGGSIMRVLYNTQQGVVGLVHPDSPVRRLFDPTTKVLLGFLWQGQQPQTQFYANQPDIFPPWDFLHFRRMMGPNEYGKGMVEHLYRIWKRLEMSLDQMAIYRLHTMPNRLAVEVATGSQDVTSQAYTLHQFREMMRGQINLNDDRFSTGYNPPALESILFIPKGEGAEHSVQTLQGDKDVPDVHDIETLTKFLYGGARVPKAYLGHEEGGEGLAKASLVTQDIRFARMIRTLRKPIVQGYHQLAVLHLAFIGKSPENYEIEVEMSRISSLEDEVNAEVVERQVAAARDLVDLLQNLNVPNKDIIELTFTEYLKLPRDFVELAALAAEVRDAAGIEGGGGGGMGGMGGGGGGMGDMGGADFGGDADMDAMSDDLAGGESPVGAFGPNDFNLPEPKEESKRQYNQIKNLLMESLKRRKIALAESGGKFALTESVKKSDKKLQESLRKLQAVGGKVSLVESYTTDHGMTGTDFKNLCESTRSKKPTEALNELISTVDSATLTESAGVESHESVGIVRRIRKVTKKK